MSLLLRSIPSLTLRFKPFSSPTPLPLTLIHLNLHGFISKRCVSSASASASSAAPSPSPCTEILPKQLPISKDALRWVSRTAFCGELCENDVGKRVRLCGWVALHRVHGGLTFVNLRDHTGLLQITTLPDEFPDARSTVNDLRLEYVIAVEGVVRSRPSESVNKKMKTGMIEVAAEHV